MFSGAITAIVTPFKDGKVDYKSYEKLLAFQLTEGINGIVPCGTTGESATLSFEEHNKVVEFTIRKVKGKVPVIAGTGANSTEEAIELTEHAAQAGADASLQVTPYYNRPTQEGLYRHFRKIAETVKLPVVLYNVPGRTGVNLLPETVIKLAEVPLIVGVKEASGSLDQVTEIVRGVRRSDFTVLSGDDSLTVPMMAVGAKGVISVASNIVPGKIAAMTALALKGDAFAAMRAHIELYELMKTLFIETNPVPVKAALALMGRIQPDVRLPLCGLSAQNAEKLSGVMKKYKLLQSK